MIKAEFASKLTEKVDITKAKAAEVTDAMLAVITESLKKGEDVNFLGFGKFEVVTVKARQSRNPRTGEKITVPEHKKVRFKVSKKLDV